MISIWYVFENWIFVNFSVFKFDVIFEGLVSIKYEIFMFRILRVDNKYLGLLGKIKRGWEGIFNVLCFLLILFTGFYFYKDWEQK